MSARDVIAEQRLRQYSTEYSNNFVIADFHGEADAILIALKAAGFAVVPVEPTEGMKKAWSDAAPMNNAALLVRYAALIKAAQEDNRE